MAILSGKVLGVGEFIKGVRAYLYVAYHKRIRIDKALSVILLFVFRYFFDYRSAMRRGYISCEETSDKINYSEGVLLGLEKTILSKMRFMQYKIPFGNAKFLIVPMRDGGFGYSMLAPLTSALAFAYHYNRTAIFHPLQRAQYEFPFKPIGAYAWDDVRKKVDREEKKFTYSLQKERIVTNVTEEYGWRFLRKTGIFGNTMNFTEPLRKVPDSFVYFIGLALDSFLELKEDYSEHIQERIDEAGILGAPVIGAHIRQGDIFVDPEVVHRYYSPSDYFRAIEEAVERTGIRNVFVATDSDKVLEQLPKDSGINFIYDDKEKRYDNCNIDMISEDPTLRKQETMTAIKNIFMLGACNYIIGSWGTQFIRFSSAIAYYRRKKRNLILIRYKRNVFITDDNLHTTRNKDGAPVSILSSW